MFSSVCRICLQDGELFSLYDKSDGAELSYSEKTMQVTSINLVRFYFKFIPATQTDQFIMFQEEKKNARLPENICTSCINDLEASYRFKMNCESSDAILQTFIEPSGSLEASEGEGEADEEIITEAESEGEPEMPVDESDLYNYQSQMYDENGEMICEEDNLENALVS